MKKIVFAILAIVVIAALILVLPVSKENSRKTESYLRIHIRANSIPTRIRNSNTRSSRRLWIL